MYLFSSEACKYYTYSWRTPIRLYLHAEAIHDYKVESNYLEKTFFKRKDLCVMGTCGLCLFSITNAYILYSSGVMPLPGLCT